MTNRIRFQDKDLSFSLPQPSGVTGFAVVRASKGTAHPTYISKGDTNTFLNLFGTPSPRYPGLKEVMDFVREYGCYVSAPAGVKSGQANKYGGVYLTTLATVEAFGSAVVENEIGEPTVDYLATFRAEVGQTSSHPFLAGSALTYDTVGDSLILADLPAYFDPGLIASFRVVFGEATEVFTLEDGDLKKGAVTVGTYELTGGKYTITVTGDTVATPLLFTLLAGGVAQTPAYFEWAQNIEEYVISSFYQTSMRNTRGSFTINKVDLDPFVINAENSGISFSPVTLSSATTASFTVLSSVATPATDVFIRVGGKTVILTPSDFATTTALATAIASGITGYSTWTATSATDTVSIVSTVAFLESTDTLNPNYNTMDFTYSEPSQTNYSARFRVSFDPEKVDTQNSSLYVEDIIGSNLFIRAIPGVKQLSDTLSTVTWGTSTSFLTGNRIVESAQFSLATDLAPTLIQGWNHASNSEYEDVMLFIDPEYSPEVATEFASLRRNTHVFSTFVTGIRVPNAVAVSKTEALAVVEALRIKRASYPMLTGLAYLVNELEVSDSYSGQKYWSIPVGSYATNLAKIMEDWQGGRSPSWTMEQGVGGVLNVSASRQKYNFDKDMVDILDLAGMNPVTKSIDFGIMVMSDKTAQDPNNVTDWSYLGHSMAFDLFKKEVKKAVMIPQIKKPIDDAHIRLREEQTTIILAKRLVGDRKIWEDGLVDVRGVNTPETKAQKNFFIKVRVKVSPFSDYVTLILENIAQTDSV